MSQQINLYDPALLKKRELLSLANLVGTALVLLLAMGGWGASARMQLAALEGESRTLAPQVKALQEQMTIFGKQLADAKPDPRIEADLAASRALLALRGEIVGALRKGVGAESTSFAEYLRGLARQTPAGLWLTGFAIGESGAAMEIRGRMTDPALLPEYIRRLNGEPAFQGRAFAALKVAAGKAEAPAPSAGAAAAPAPASTGPAPFHEFTLIPVRAAAPADAAAKPEDKR